jgi:hypothetical protein
MGKVQEAELDACRAPAGGGREIAGCGGREKPKRVLPAQFWIGEKSGVAGSPAPESDWLGCFLSLGGRLGFPGTN